MTKEELKNRLQAIIDRTSSSVDDDKMDALDALFDYLDDPDIEEMYERICE